jgi:putative FmdB family regulatory protein
VPIYGFQCDDCGKEFETLVTASEKAACPTCDSHKLTRQLSLIAKPARGGESAPAMACSAGADLTPCGSGACRFAGGGCG